MDRYALIHTKMPREFVLLQGTGCRWGKCTFCDYHSDTSDNPFAINEPILRQVTGQYGVLDIINSGSAMELDDETISLIREVVREKHIHTLWFEAHYMYRKKLADFAQLFAPAKVKFRCGVETFSPTLRDHWKKGIPTDVTAEDVAKYFQGVCLLCCTEGENREHILTDIALAREHFEWLAGSMSLLGTLCHLAEYRLGRSRKGKAANSHTVPIIYVTSSLGCCYNRIIHSNYL